MDISSNIIDEIINEMIDDYLYNDSFTDSESSVEILYEGDVDLIAEIMSIEEIEKELENIEKD